MHNHLHRRSFLKTLMMLSAGLTLPQQPWAFSSEPLNQGEGNASSTVFRAVNGSPAANLVKLLEVMGGIETLVGSDDVVVLKPNVQWWNQGAPNLQTIKTLVELIFDRPGGFSGEVIIAENCHRGPAPWGARSSGWAHSFGLNADVDDVLNMNGLCSHLKGRFQGRFSTCHWIDVQQGTRRIAGPGDAPGYVFCDGENGVPSLVCENECTGKDWRSTIMTYPIFVTDRGTVIDFKNGVWERGSYTGQPLRFFNLAAVNYHSTFCGMTSAIKNYMGITDLSGGSDPARGGKLTERHYNFHSFAFDGSSPGPQTGILGTAIGMFMKTVRKADLNITTAEWVGLSSRVDGPVAWTRAILASEDPVALDYHAAKYLLYPNSRISYHDPDWEQGPLRQYLAKCAKEMGGVLDERRVAVRSIDVAAGRLQRDDEAVVRGDVTWVGGLKPIVKYLLLRSGLV